MQALRGSVFGIGTDIGGSVSMPASFNGIFSLKPSTGRISMKGVASPGPGQQIMPATAGIMGPSIATARLVLKSLLSTEPWLHDPYVVPLPWRDTEEYRPDGGIPSEADRQNRPTFGFMEDDGVVTPHPPVQRALQAVKSALGKLGYNVRTIDSAKRQGYVSTYVVFADSNSAPDNSVGTPIQLGESRDTRADSSWGRLCRRLEGPAALG